MICWSGALLSRDDKKATERIIEHLQERIDYHILAMANGLSTKQYTRAVSEVRAHRETLKEMEKIRQEILNENR